MKKLLNSWKEKFAFVLCLVLMAETLYSNTVFAEEAGNSSLEKDGFYYVEVPNTETVVYIPTYYPYYVVRKYNDRYFSYCAENPFVLCYDSEDETYYMTSDNTFEGHLYQEDGYHVLTFNNDAICPDGKYAYALEGIPVKYNVETEGTLPTISDGDVDPVVPDVSGGDIEQTYSVQTLTYRIDDTYFASVTGLLPDNGSINVSMEGPMPDNQVFTDFYVNYDYNGLFPINIKAFNEDKTEYIPEKENEYEIVFEGYTADESFSFLYDNATYDGTFVGGYPYIQNFNFSYFGNWKTGGYTESGYYEDENKICSKDYIQVNNTISYTANLMSGFCFSICEYDEAFNCVKSSEIQDQGKISFLSDTKFIRLTCYAKNQTNDTYAIWYDRFNEGANLSLVPDAETAVSYPFLKKEYTATENSITYKTSGFETVYAGTISLKDEYYINTFQTLTFSTGGLEFTAEGYFPNGSELYVEIKEKDMLNDLSMQTNAVYALDGEYVFYMCILVAGHAYTSQTLNEITGVVIKGISLDEDVLNGTYIVKDLNDVNTCEILLTQYDPLENIVTFTTDTAAFCSGEYIGIGEFVFNRNRYDILSDPFISDIITDGQIMRIEKVFDASAAGDGSVMGTLYENGTLIISGTGELKESPINKEDRPKIKYAYFDAGISLGSYSMNSLMKDCTEMEGCDISNLPLDNLKECKNTFAGCANLVGIKGIENMRFANKAFISFLFSGCVSLKKLDLSEWNTENLYKADCVFCDTNIDFQNTLDNKDFSHCITLTGIFQNAKPKNIDVSGWSVGKNADGVNVSYMFYNACMPYAMDLTGWEFDKFTSITAVCKNMQAPSIDISGQSFSGVRYSNAINSFRGMKITGSIIARNCIFNTPNDSKKGIADMLFEGCSAEYIDISGSDFRGLENLHSTFMNCRTEKINITNINLSETKSLYRMFSTCKTLKEIEGFETVDFSAVESVANMFEFFDGESISLHNNTFGNIKEFTRMFYRCDKLITVDGIEGWDMHSAEYLSYMFNVCRALKTIPIENWDTGNVKTVEGMFESCSSLESLDLSNWDTHSMQITKKWFGYCGSLVSLGEIGNWYFPDLENASFMFLNCVKLKNIGSGNLTGWQIKNLNNAEQMFAGCRKMPSLDMSDWNMSKVTTTYRMFYQTWKMEDINCGNWRLTALENGSQMFLDSCCKSMLTTNMFTLNGEQDTNLESLMEHSGTSNNLTLIEGIDTWKMDTVISLKRAFRNNCAWAQNLDLSSWRMPKLTDVSYMFYNCNNLPSININNWGCQKKTDNSYMFYYCYNAARIDMSGAFLKTSSLNHCFYNCNKLETLIGYENLDTSECETCEFAFTACKSFTELNLSRWILPVCVSTKSMFDKCVSLTTTGDISGFQFGVNEDTSNMFNTCYKLEYIGDISGWDMSTVKNISGMFFCGNTDGCVYKENVGDLSKWDLSNVTASDSAFEGQHRNNISIPDTLKIIGKQMYLDNYIFSDSTLPPQVESVGDYAFFNCPQMLVTQIPESLNDENIGDFAFPTVTYVKFVEDDAIINEHSNVVEGPYPVIGYYNSPLVRFCDVKDLFVMQYESCSNKKDAYKWLFYNYTVLLTEEELNLLTEAYNFNVPSNNLNTVNVVEFKGNIEDYEAATDDKGNIYYYDYSSLEENLFTDRYVPVSDVVDSGKLVGSTTGIWTFYKNGDMVFYSETPTTMRNEVWAVTFGFNPYISQVKNLIFDGITNVPSGLTCNGWSSLEKAVLKEGVTTVGNNFMYSTSSAQKNEIELYLPSTTQSVGDYITVGNVYYNGNAIMFRGLANNIGANSKTVKNCDNFINLNSAYNMLKTNKTVYGLCYYTVLTDPYIGATKLVKNYFDTENDILTAKEQQIKLTLSDDNKRYVGEKYFLVTLSDLEGNPIDLDIVNEKGETVNGEKLLANKEYYINIPVEYFEESGNGYQTSVKVNSEMTIKRIFTGSNFTRTQVTNKSTESVKFLNVELLNIR